ncbi:hypothetical protein GYH30_023508 [Glycine max]|nr:hypothetical protein GYH30_023508 [Glycine max]
MSLAAGILSQLQKSTVRLLDHWLKSIAKSFSIALSHVQTRNNASSILLPLNVSFEKVILFLCCQIDQVKVTHQHFHLLHIIPPFIPFPYCRKCCLGFRGNAPEVLTQDRDSHHKGSVLVQLKNKWTASSSLFLQKGHIKSLTSTCLLRKLDLVGNRSLISRQAKIDVLVEILSFHRSAKAPSKFSSAVSPCNRLYALFVE